MHQIIQGINDETIDIHAIDLVWNACADLLDSADYIVRLRRPDIFDLDRMKVPRLITESMVRGGIQS